MVHVEVDCGGQRHVLTITDGGRLVLLAHPGDQSDDDVLVALSGRPARCRELERAWNGLDDARALGLAHLDSAGLRLATMRAAAALDQQRQVARRDDLTEAQRSAFLAQFDQVVFAGAVASLGPAFVRARAALASRRRRFRWRRRSLALRR